MQAAAAAAVAMAAVFVVAARISIWTDMRIYSTPMHIYKSAICTSMPPDDEDDE